VTLPEFLEELFAEGRVTVREPTQLTPDELRAADDVLNERQRVDRLELPEDVPPYQSRAGLQAAAHFYQACQLAVFRDLGAEAIAALAKCEPDDWAHAGVHYSVDLTFRYLPDLVRIAQSAAADDPLVELLIKWCYRWPLSSVGVQRVGDVNIEPIVASPGLMQLYVDRIIAREDFGRTASAPVRNAVRHAFGLYPRLAPKFSDAVS